MTDKVRASKIYKVKLIEKERGKEKTKYTYIQIK